MANKKIEETFLLCKYRNDEPKTVEAYELICKTLSRFSLYYEFCDCNLSSRDVINIYPKVPPVILYLMQERLVGVPLDLFKVRGVGAIDGLRAIRGSENDPRTCGQGTLRAQLVGVLGYRKLRIMDSSGKLVVTTWDNYVHVPSREELPQNRRIFAKFFRT